MDCPQVYPVFARKPRLRRCGAGTAVACGLLNPALAKDPAIGEVRCTQYCHAGTLGAMAGSAGMGKTLLSMLHVKGGGFVQRQVSRFVAPNGPKALGVFAGYGVVAVAPGPARNGRSICEWQQIQLS